VDSQREDPRPRVAVTLGDPAGIGPEIALAVAADAEVRAAARLLLLGPGELLPESWDRVRREDDNSLAGPEHLALDTGGGPRFERGVARAESGRAALSALRAGHELALARRVQALVTAPVSKQALHLAGERVEGQTELLARWSDAPRTQMLAVAGPLRVLLLTRHLPLAQAIAAIQTESVEAHLELLHTGLVGFGIARPRLALAGLNPHAGEGGLLGDEEQRLLEPAVQAARARGLDVSGPVSPDSVFAQAAAGRFDGVLALYHDQAFIPVKLLDPLGGLTVLLGLPYLRVSPAHGTAFDIAGRGLASPDSLRGAVLQAARWALAAPRVEGGR
jgi:4-phospho-D-threonate 3-dehydrogenase / 4-phospho-D-erythronate 3-dehydrogenase